MLKYIILIIVIYFLMLRNLNFYSIKPTFLELLVLIYLLFIYSYNR